MTAAFRTLATPGSVESRVDRYRLLKWRSDNAAHLGNGGARICMTPRQGGVEVDVSVEGLPHVRGIRRCGSPHACPVCSPNIRATRAAEVQAGVQAWWKAGGFVTLVTLTLPHARSTPLQDTLTALTGAYSQVFAGRYRQELRDALGLVGRISAIEVTYGESGWHPHIHALFFTTRPVKPGILSSAWRQRFQALGVGHKFVPRVSIDVRPVKTKSHVAHYLTKMQGGWSPGAELARGDLKRASGASITPPAFLSAAAVANDRRTRAFLRWQEYERALKGVPLVRWTPGLARMLGVHVRTDEGAAEGERPDRVAAQLVVPGYVWLAARSNGSLGVLLADLVAGRWRRWHAYPVCVPPLVGCGQPSG